MPNDAQVDAGQTIVALRRELAALSAERDEALAERAAIGEITQIVNGSPGDLAPVFDAIPEKTHSLCEVAYGGLAVYDGEHFRIVATRGNPEHVSEAVRRPFRGNIHSSSGVGARLALLMAERHTQSRVDAARAGKPCLNRSTPSASWVDPRSGAYGRS